MKYLFAFLLLLTACAAPSPQDNASPAATLTPAPTPSPTPALPTTFAGGQNADGTFYRGSADAPITLIEYSDYL